MSTIQSSTSRISVPSNWSRADHPRPRMMVKAWAKAKADASQVPSSRVVWETELGSEDVEDAVRKCEKDAVDLEQTPSTGNASQ
mmetsp:Transcript_52318/g.139317  ORF Transcript_52318/g.139317 Transcript_52318/m.139317 type:complete len:84 (+) Transcript_52318:675-926(+)